MNTNALPPGLVNRNGKLMDVKHRLPSLKNSTNAKIPLILNGSNTLTKGGAVKRQFKPKIPAGRASDPSTSANSSSENLHRKEKGSRDSSKDSKKKSNFRKKEYVQLEGAVFTGINAALAPVRHSSDFRGESTRRFTPKVASQAKESKEVKKENSIDASIYRDDFIASSSDDDEDDRPPKGWTNVSSSKDVTEKSTFVDPAVINLHSLQGRSQEDNLMLIQLPTVLVNKPEGRIGKLRLYKSGRVAFVDDESDLVLDVLRSNSYPDDSLVKTENCRTKETGLHQQVVSFSGNDVVSLGQLHQRNVLVGVPLITEHLEAYCEKK